MSLCNMLTVHTFHFGSDHCISLLLPSSRSCPCFPHIFISHLFLFIFCILPHPPSTICSNTLLPSTEPQALAHVVMSYGSSTEAWELPPLLDANTMSIKQLWHWCHPLFVILPFSLFYSLHSLSHLIHCEGSVDTFSRAEAGEGVRG